MTKQVKVGNITLGNGRVVIQSMTNTLTSDIPATREQILNLHSAGAELVRVSIPDFESAKAVSELKTTGVSLIGDIHYDYRLAITAIENGIDKIRINPSNTSASGIKEIISACKERNIPIRVGVNKGSVKGSVTPEELAEKTLESVKMIENAGYNEIVAAVKTSDLRETVQAYRHLKKYCDYPLHIGLTEAGIGEFGLIKSAIAIGSLLVDGIGDTVRVSLTGDPIKEIYAAKEILKAVGAERNFVDIIACPTCARTCIEVEKLAEAVRELTKRYDFPMKVAVMGCTVNGIGESKGAKLGVAGGKSKSALFLNGEIIKTVPNEEILEELGALIKDISENE